MKTIETIKRENYFITLYDLIEDKLEEIRKANGWKKMTDERYKAAMEKIANDLNVNAADLMNYYEE